MIKKRSNQGFSLVELIIVIAIMAILAAAIAPALIRYINKARKADDIVAASVIGTSVNAAISTDDDMYSYVQWSVKELHGSSDYRVLGWSNVASSSQGSTFNANFQMSSISAGHGDAASNCTKFLNFVRTDLCDELVVMRFQKFSKLDQWILCVDKDSKLSVWVGASFQLGEYTIPQSGINGSKHYYMLWPEVNKTYNMFASPNDAP